MHYVSRRVCWTNHIQRLVGSLRDQYSVVLVQSCGPGFGSGRLLYFSAYSVSSATYGPTLLSPSRPSDEWPRRSGGVYATSQSSIGLRRQHLSSWLVLSCIHDHIGCALSAIYLSVRDVAIRCAVRLADRVGHDNSALSAGSPESWGLAHCGVTSPLCFRRTTGSNQPAKEQLKLVAAGIAVIENKPSYSY